MAYVSYLNNGQQSYEIKDRGARREIESIKDGVTGAMHWLGISSTEIEDGDREGKWTIDGKDYTLEYIDIILGQEEHSPTVRYYRDDTLDQGYEYAEDVYRMVGYRVSSNVSEPIPEIVYIMSGNKQTLTISEVSIDTGNSYGEGKWASYTSVISGADIINYYSPKKQNAYPLKNGHVAGYSRKEFVWGFYGWREFGDLGSFNKKKMERTVVHDTPSLSGGSTPTMSYNDQTETLTFNPGAFPAIAAGTAVSVATGKTTTDGDGDYVITPNQQ